MSSIIRVLAIASLAMPVFALETNDVSGTWQGDGEATWAVMLQDPQIAYLPQDQQSLMHASTLAVLSEIRCTFNDGVVSIATTPAEAEAQQSVAMSKLDQAVASRGKDGRRWTSIGDREATWDTQGQNGRRRTHHIERIDANRLRITTQESGDDAVRVILLRRVVPNAGLAP